jgi:asparagine synthetase B (glutamine-hydrolysing)
MCGIVAGIANENHRVCTQESLQAFEASCNEKVLRISHRGPNETGVEIVHERRAWLGHSRLSIVAPEKGHQPIANKVRGEVMPSVYL